MLPTQPICCGKHWWSPHFDYHMNSRFAWPTPPPQVAEAAAAAGALGAGAGAHAAEGAAANFASHAGGGGVPPRGPWGYHNYYGGYGRYGKYGRRWGRRPPSRFLWLLIGIGGTAWYFKSQERRREYERRLSGDTSTTQPNVHTWGWNHQCRHRQIPSSPSPSTTPNSLNDPNVTVNSTTHARYPDQLDDGKMAWGWKAWRERKAAREEAWRLSRQEQNENQFQEEKEKKSIVFESEPERNSTKNPEMSKISLPPPTAVNQDNGEMYNLKEVFEKLWEEKKKDAVKVSENANDKAKEYARDKLDKLSAALDTLRESLKQDAEVKAQKAQEAEKKWV